MAGLTGLLPKNTYGDILNMNNSGAGIPSALTQVADGLGVATGLFLGQTQIGIAGNDIGLKRVAAGVAAVTNGSTLLGWLQEIGYANLSSGFTKANATLGATNLSITVIAGRSYQISGVLQVSNTTAGEGVQIAFDGGACSATTFFMASQAVGTVVAGTVVSTTLAGVINYTSITGTDYLMLMGFLKANVGGTFIMRAAENTTSTGTVTIGAGSWLAMTDSTPL